MNIVLPLFLMLLAFGGGIALTYAIMDSPRRQAKAKEEKLDRQLLDAEEFQEELDRRERKLNARITEAERFEAGLKSREQSLAARQHEYDRRAVSYSDLENENRLLRSELRNHTLHAAYLEHLRQFDRAGRTSVSDQRDELGFAYFKEVAGWTRKSINAGNLPRIRSGRRRGETSRSAGPERLGGLLKHYYRAAA